MYNYTLADLINLFIYFSDMEEEYFATHLFDDESYLYFEFKSLRKNVEDLLDNYYFM